MKTRHTDTETLLEGLTWPIVNGEHEEEEEEEEEEERLLPERASARVISTRSRSRALTTPTLIVQRRTLPPREVYVARRRTKRKKYSTYPDIEFAAAKRTKQNSGQSNQENNQDEAVNCANRSTQPRPHRQSNTLTRHGLQERRLRRELGEEYDEIIAYETDKPYGLRRERQIVVRYEAPNFREVPEVVEESSDDADAEEDDEEEDEEEDDEEEEEDEGERGNESLGYSLRRKPPKTVRYEDASFSEHKREYPHREYASEGGWRVSRKRGRTRRTVSNQSTTSDSEQDETHFEKRKQKSMNRARSRCLPMNLQLEDIQKGLFRERLKAGASMADIDPMSLDKSTDFTSVGGLQQHLTSLREMIIFPMLYPEVFEKFDVNPPRGVIFYGSPGTGKTLVARALANECSKDGQKISFFMRKGADCLSKWVGESERQLRLLFDQAYSMRPSIIFFDEIDGLAPVRSSRQEQIHSSIVSTLLALMDGLDSRGEVIVIGATNRLDTIDPALRRPGRFDREFHFPLPTCEARAEILKIHTKKWDPIPSPEFLLVLAERSVGFCGADLKSLVTESALIALRRRYPQIYNTNKRLLLDPSSIHIKAQDFYLALQKMTPAQARSGDKSRQALSPNIRPLLGDSVLRLVDYVKQVMPSIKCNMTGLPASSAAQEPSKVDHNAVVSGDPPIYKSGVSRNVSHEEIDGFFSTLSSLFNTTPSHRPRLLIENCNTLVIGALLHALEDLPLHTISLSTLYSSTYSSPEEACARVISAAVKSAPSILYIPHLSTFDSSCTVTVSNIIITALEDIDPSTQLLLVATDLSAFGDEGGYLYKQFVTDEIISLVEPTTSQTQLFFSPLFSHEMHRPPPTNSAKEKEEEILEEAPPLKPKPLTKQEIASIERQESSTMRELRLFLRDLANKLMKERKFYCFCKPVNLDEVSDYTEVISKPMDLETIRVNIDNNIYDTPASFIADVDLICENAIEYNPEEDHTGRQIRHRAAELRDYAHSLLDAELDLDFEKLCKEIKEARQKRKNDDLLNGSEYTLSSNIPGHTGMFEDSNDSSQSSFGGCTDISSELVRLTCEVLRGASVDQIIKLYTLCYQVIMKHRDLHVGERHPMYAELRDIIRLYNPNS